MTSCFGLAGRLLATGALLALSLMMNAALAADAPGGFIENDTPTAARLLVTTASSDFLPQRGLFTFPAPYNTQGVRITNSTDCGGQDCVDMIYSYWRNMSNSAGSNTMYMFIGLDRSRGGLGPTLFSYDKTTDQLTELGPMFPSSSPFSWKSAEGWYFSYGMPTKVYLQSGSKLMRYDVLAKTMETVFDSTTQYPGTVITQTNSSNDDDVHSATLEDSTTSAKEGCVAYKVSTRQFYFYPTTGGFDECQIDKSGRYLVIKEKLPEDSCTSCDEDNLIVDLQTGSQTILLDKDGAGGHSDLGYGTQVAADNWNSYANAWRTWDLSQASLQGGLVYHDNNWGTFAPSHISFENAQPGVPLSQQYACGGSVTASGTSYGNEIVCFMLDPGVAVTAEQRLVVAPVMSDLSAVGGNATCPSCTAYGKDPKGNIDPTGHYFFWVSNMGGARMDAFMVKIPYQVLTGATSGGAGSSDTVPPAVSMTSPGMGATLTGTVTLSASASDNVGVASVQFLLDGAPLGSAITGSSYTMPWDSSSVAAGTHILSAQAKDAAGNTSTAGSVTITTYVAPLPTVISGVVSSVTGSSTATVSWNTDQLSTSQVAFGTTSVYGANTTLDPTMVTVHSAVLASLKAGTLYHYQVISTDSSGLQTVSPDQTFNTPAGAAVVTLPAATANWQFDAGSGATATDSSGNGHTGALVKAPGWATGVAGDALSFNGSTQYVSVSNVSYLDRYPMTVNLWFKTAASSGVQGLVNKYVQGTRNGYRVFLYNGKLCAWYFRDSNDYIWDGSGCTLRVPGYNDGQWHMATFTVDASGGQLYVDGSIKATRGWNGAAGGTTTSATLLLGYQGRVGSYFAGSLDEVRIYRNRLSATQVATLYAGYPRLLPVAWINLVNLTGTGSSLQKTGGCDGCEDATAHSQQQIAAGASGYLQFTATETNTLRSAGLARVGASLGYANMDYALRLQSGNVEVREKGVYKAGTSFVSGDVFRIAVDAGVVDYYKNGTVFYTSSTIPTNALQASVAFNSLGGTVTSAMIKTQ